MDNILTEAEIRVLGSLMEKEMTTPDHYPLSLNALTNACNQKSNRDPVVSYEETTVIDAISSLKEKRFAWQSDAGRVAKYSQNFTKINDLSNKEAALICLLLLRGPQTPGELRSRSDRLYKFDNLEEVEEALAGLSDLEMAVKLPRLPGRREARYTHLLAGKPEMEEHPGTQPGSEATVKARGQDRIAELEREITLLREELKDLRKEFVEFREIFD